MSPGKTALSVSVDGPKGLHVAHILIDGGINGERLKTLRSDAVAQRGKGCLLEINAIAEALLAAPPSAQIRLDAVKGPASLQGNLRNRSPNWRMHMPLARIDLIKGKPAAYRHALGEAVYQALLSIDVPEDDRFQVINEHEPANFIFAQSYLGVDHTDDLVIIQITLNEGRVLEQKQALFRAIAEGIHAATGLAVNDIFVNLVEVKRENWSFGNGVAQYAAR